MNAVQTPPALPPGPPREGSGPVPPRRPRPLPGWVRAVAVFLLPVHLLASIPSHLLASATAYPVACTARAAYDTAGQLRRAVLNGDSADPGSGVWSYDAAGNRTSAQAGAGTLSTAVPTPTNALFSLSGGGKVRVAGSLSEWASVTVNGQAASLDAGSNTFEASVPLAAGSQTLTVSATDASGNAATSRYQLTISAGAGLGFGYDASGNTTALTPAGSGGSAAPAQSLEWDAANRLTAINTGAHRTEFGYDGSGARVQMTEREGGACVSDRLFVAGEERDAASGQVLRRFFGQGEQRMGGSTADSYFYNTDHLGSLREMTDGGGAVRVSYGYRVWGERSKLGGDLEAERGFTGYWHHAPSGLEVSPTRLYSAGLGRFMSQDPIQEAGGINLYRYCANDPVNLVDPLGLFVSSAPQAEAETAFIFGADAAAAAAARQRAAAASLLAAGLGLLSLSGNDGQHCNSRPGDSASNDEDPRVQYIPHNPDAYEQERNNRDNPLDGGANGLVRPDGAGAVGRRVTINPFDYNIVFHEDELSQKVINSVVFTSRLLAG